MGISYQDALVVMTNIDNFDVERCLVDGGSSVDILSFDAFSKMGYIKEDLRPISYPLYEFSGYLVVPMGKISLNVVLGQQGSRRSHKIEFIIVDMLIAYNTILGRPILAAFEAVASVYHICMKFPARGQVGVVQGIQLTSRKFFVDTIKRKQPQ